MRRLDRSGTAAKPHFSCKIETTSSFG